jgi:transmembrane sensor
VTATGERLNISLDDGSQVTLNTRTELEVTLTARERYIHLIHGQALFDVAHDHNRPFVVEADSRRFIAVGTAFDVRLDAGSVELTMLEGTVRVEHAPAPPPPQRSDAAKSAAARRGPAGANDAGRSNVGERTAGAELLAQSSGGAYIPRLVAAGEQLKAGEGSDDRVLPADAERVTSWRRGQIIFDNTRLGDAIAEVNRYSATQLRLEDPALAELRLSGAFSTSRPRLFVEALTNYFPVQIERADEHVMVLGARH